MTARFTYGDRSTPAHLGARRAMTETEREHLKILHKAAPTTPPWTPESEARRRDRDAEVLWLFEDGVSQSELTDALGLSDAMSEKGFYYNAGVRVMLKRARAAGYGTGTRRYIAPTSKRPAPPAYERLTDAEAATLRAIHDACPIWRAEILRTNGEPSRRVTPEFLTTVLMLRRRRITLQSIADAVGVRRERVRQWQRQAEDMIDLVYATSDPSPAPTSE